MATLNKLSTKQKDEIVGNIKAGNVSKSIANDLLELLGYGRAIKPKDVK